MTGAVSPSFCKSLISHLPRLRRFAAGLSGNVATADDLVQDCIERALTNAGSLRDIDRMGPWLRSILYNLYTDELRKRRRRGRNVDILDMSNDIALSISPSGQSVPKDILCALDSLSAEHRQILLLAGMEGLGYREIAEELGIPMGTVMSRLARARERFRDALESEEVLSSNVHPLTGRRIAP
jgi:RNA polymerase sigma-70 factor (ECF subfamily)